MKPKTIFTIIATTFLVVACNNDNDHASIPEEDTQSVFMKYNPANELRSVEGSASGQTAEFLSALVYFLDNAADPIVYAVRSVGAASGSTATIAQLVAGVEFTGIPESVTQVYIVGNYNSSDINNNTAAFPITPGITLSTIQATILNIQEVAYPRLNATNYTELLTILDGSANIVAYDDNPAGWTGSGTPASGDYYANVTISPVNARIEMNELAYTGTLTSFEVEGIYINNYYANMPLNLQTTDPGTTFTNNGSTASFYDRSNVNFAYTNYSTLYDIVEDAVTPAGGVATVNPGTGVWAYHVFGNHNPVPHIIIKFTDVIDAGGNNVGERYLTVRGFTQNSNSQELSTLSRGNIYQIASLAFDDNDLQILPETEAINIWVQVTVTPWSTVPVTPIL